MDDFKSVGDTFLSDEKQQMEEEEENKIRNRGILKQDDLAAGSIPAHASWYHLVVDIKPSHALLNFKGHIVL